jgi:hypothetical protein
LSTSSVVYYSVQRNNFSLQNRDGISEVCDSIVVTLGIDTSNTNVIMGLGNTTIGGNVINAAVEDVE